MIWLDSSFIVEWLLGTERTQGIDLGQAELGVLPMQYLEVVVYFLRHGQGLETVTGKLEGLELYHPEKVDLQKAAFLYQDARNKKSKASMADAILSSVAHRRGEKLISFDSDFSYLGFKEADRFWVED